MWRAIRLVPCLALIAAAAAGAQANRRTLRVCADPNNLPFSNVRGEGFENKLAELVAKELGARLEYTWWAQRRGFIRNTLKANRCDVVMGVPAQMEMVATTRPYYRSTYAFVVATGARPPSSLDDPALRALRIGVPLVGDDGANPPPVLALARRHIVENVRGYSVYGNYSKESPPSDLIEAVRRNEVDVAIAWGPLAGYYAKARAPALRVVPLEAPEDESLPFAFDISVGVRRSDTSLRDELDALLLKRRKEIAALLDGYGVPRL
jgi:mxaJ protein